MSLLISYKAGEAKRIENRSARHRLNSLFFSVQNNQLHKIVGYLYPNHALFVLYFVQLDNKPLIITITVSSNLIGTLAALFFNSRSVQL